MNPGELRHVVEIIRPSQAQDETGQRVDGWESVAADVRASKSAVPGTEGVTSAGVQTVARVQTLFRVRMPRTFTIDPTMRVVHEQKLFQIVGAVDLEGRDRELHLTCEELVGEPPWQSST